MNRRCEKLKKKLKNRQSRTKSLKKPGKRILGALFDDFSGKLTRGFSHKNSKPIRKEKNAFDLELKCFTSHSSLDPIIGPQK